jgi:hypothetical protein
MRLFLLLAFFLLASFCRLHAQDTLVLRSDEHLLVKILEITPTEVKYKRTNNPDGPLYSNFKWEVRYITYSNGTQDHFKETKPAPITQTGTPENKIITIKGQLYSYNEQTIREGKMLNIVRTTRDLKLNALVKKTTNNKAVQFICCGAGFGLMGIGLLRLALGSGMYDNTPATQAANKIVNREVSGFLCAGIACEVVSITFKIRHTENARLTVESYNNYILQKP